jgi:hypothetical protein
MGTPPNGPADGPYRDIAYNATVEQINGEYEVLIGRPWDMSGAHTLGHNDKSLGLCLVGNFNLAPPPLGQLAIAAKFISMWQRIYSIPTEQIFEHRDFSSTDCPGDFFDLDELKELLT